MSTMSTSQFTLGVVVATIATLSVGLLSLVFILWVEIGTMASAQPQRVAQVQGSQAACCESSLRTTLASRAYRVAKWM
ncbi:hypothetical protein DSM104443_02321 [Usitatibacter rugosus]|uniref:Uncharacterized protein n=1 Tax=Usitatibacter rugosus TaxID=2732067 RepID=A0A6M4GWK1_9PROT|nr:hypothetical protein [Usitatibacter rugosus]QJR11248.1 hypothetical protein DSM104443_02321 [Usitatibacter rugosus]